MKTILLEKISKTGDLIADLIMRQYKLDKMAGYGNQVYHPKIK